MRPAPWWRGREGMEAQRTAGQSFGPPPDGWAGVGSLQCYRRTHRQMYGFGYGFGSEAYYKPAQVAEGVGGTAWG